MYYWWMAWSWKIVRREIFHSVIVLHKCYISVTGLRIIAFLIKICSVSNKILCLFTKIFKVLQKCYMGVTGMGILAF